MSNDDFLDNLPTLAPQEGELIPASSTTGNGGYEQGFRDGLSIGIQIGHQETIARVQAVLPELIHQEIMRLPDVKAALSDGLRHGSSECGKVLVDIYRYGKRGLVKK